MIVTNREGRTNIAIRTVVPQKLPHTAADRRSPQSCGLVSRGRTLCRDRKGLQSGKHSRLPTTTKKADVAEHPKVFDHVGLLVNEPPGTAGLLFK